MAEPARTLSMRGSAGAASFARRVPLGGLDERPRQAQSRPAPRSTSRTTTAPRSIGPRPEHLGNVDIDSSATAAGLAAGPFLGWKFLTKIGFTAVIQAGAEFALVHADANGGTAKRRAVYPLLNLKFGWSF